MAHNVWDPAKKSSVAKVLHSFGREDELDPDALGRLAVSINRYLGIDDDDGRPGRVDARERQWDATAQRVLFMLVANRAQAPTDHKSKLASLTWLRDVELPGVAELGDDPNVCYRAMDWLLEIEDDLAEAVYWATADLLDLEVDLLLFDHPADPGSGSALALAA